MQSLNGILLFNKPIGYTSQQTVSKIKHLLHIKKAGHTGSLDPIATGLLPICLGEATKFSQFLLTADKHYRVEAKLGQQTDTGDCEGSIIEQKPTILFQQDGLEKILSEFRGNILQTPPMFSAIKHQGKPLYHWARQGVKIPRPSRPVTIYDLNLLAYHKDHLSLEVRCSKGTYIRSLIEDIGKKIGCGAHVTGLHRLSVGEYTTGQSVDLSILEALTIQERLNWVLPLETALSQHWPTMKISDPAAFYLRRGQALNLPNTPPTGWVRLLLKSNNKFFGLGHILKDGRLASYRLMSE